MKKVLAFILVCSFLYSTAQEHFSGINTTKHVGILSTTINPAEINNLYSKSEFSLVNFSINASNNKISINDVLKDENFEEKIFEGDEPVNLRIDALIVGPSFGMKIKKWGIGIFLQKHIKVNAIDIDATLGDAVSNSVIGLKTAINAGYNQRINAITWEEIGLNLGREFWIGNNHKFTAGASVKLLFPNAYMNFGISNLSGDLYDLGGNIELTNATAQLNIAYSGALADDYSDSSNYTKIFKGGVNGFATDIGVTYQLKPTENNDYKLKLGASIKNMGSMKFKEDNNVNTQYNLDINQAELESLNLNQFEDVESISDIEDILLSTNLVTRTEQDTNFKIKLPTTFNAYVDYKLLSKFYLSAYLQQKMNDDENNDVITTQNVFSVTPRFSTKSFEAYIPFAQNEISDFTTGFGLRVGGFFLGSGSAITALLSDSHQADIYFGYRMGF